VVMLVSEDWGCGVVICVGVVNVGIRIVVIILVVKIYAVHISVGRVKHSGGGTENLLKWYNITRNDVETFVPFSGILTTIILSEQIALFLGSPTAYQGISLFFVCLYAIARICFTVFYAIGMQPWRSISFVVALFSMVLLGWMSLGVIAHNIGTKFSTAIDVMIMLDLTRTWFVGTSTSFNRGKAGLVLTEEDRALPGVKQTTEDTDAAILSQILASIQTKDCQIQLATFFAVRVLTPVSLTDMEVNGYISVVALWFLSRIAYTVVAVLKLKPLILSSIALFSVTMVVVLLVWDIVRLISPGPI